MVSRRWWPLWKAEDVYWKCAEEVQICDPNIDSGLTVGMGHESYEYDISPFLEMITLTV